MERPRHMQGSSQKGQGKEGSEGRPTPPEGKEPSALALAQAEVDFWKDRVPSSHHRLLQAKQSLEDLKQKSFLALPLKTQAQRLKQSIQDDRETLGRMKAGLVQVESEIDAKCLKYQQRAAAINERIEKLKEKIQQFEGHRPTPLHKVKGEKCIVPLKAQALDV